MRATVNWYSVMLFVCSIESPVEALRMRAFPPTVSSGHFS